MPAEVVEEKSASPAPPVPPETVEPSPPAAELAVEPVPPAAELAVGPSAPLAPPAPSCANCQATLTGPFCSQCGQHVRDYHQSVWRFVADFFDNVFCWDNKLFRTLGPLFKRPGLLTQEFMAGRRMRYVHPLRLFLFTSAVCLTLLQFNHGFDKARIQVGKKAKPGVSFHLGEDDKDDEDTDDKAPAKPTPSPAASAAPLPVSAPTPSVLSTPSPSPAPASADKVDSFGQILRDTFKAGVGDQKGKNPQADEDLSKRWEAIGKDIEKKARSADGIKAVNQKIATNIQQKASWVALAMLPIFAWIMRFAYGRRGGYFFNYLVFSLHYHTFLLLFWTAYLWLGTAVKAIPFAPLGFLLLPLLLAPPWYLYLALRRFYGESRFHTAAKTLAIGGVHLLAIIIGVAIAGVGSSL